MFSWSPKWYLSTWNKPSSCPGEETALSWHTVIAFPAMTNDRSVLHSLQLNNPYILAGGTKGSSNTGDKILQRKPVGDVLKVAAFLGYNTAFLVNLVKAAFLIWEICYRFKSCQISPFPFTVLMQSEQKKHENLHLGNMENTGFSTGLCSFVPRLVYSLLQD